MEGGCLTQPALVYTASSEQKAQKPIIQGAYSVLRLFSLEMSDVPAFKHYGATASRTKANSQHGRPLHKLMIF